MRYVTLDENNLVVSAGQGKTIPTGAMPIKENYSLNKLGDMMWNGSQLVPRPNSPMPYLDEGDVVIPACPLGTEIHIFDLVGKERLGIITADTEGFSEVITFPDPGTYDVEVYAPVPYLPTMIRVVL